MKKIKLTQGKYALVDDADFEYLNQFNWYYHKRGYALRSEKYKKIRMHTDVMGVGAVDHINGKKLDNQRTNLRFATIGQNNCNRGKTKANKVGYKGVFIHSQKKIWQKRFCAQICIEGKKHHLGVFSTAEEAHDAYKKAAIELHGAFAKW